MNFPSLIHKTRDRIPLTRAEIQHLVAGVSDGSIPDYQIAAWLMAVRLQGLTVPETIALALAMRDSGEHFDPSPLGKFAVDKHSTGGVGDKTSFLVAPIAAFGNACVPMIGGRALGHTGGTLDKLESIPGYRTELSPPQMFSMLATSGAFIVGQSRQLVPADRKLYALRDVTGTVESPYLIAASIMSKKLAEGLNGLVLDVKMGSGAFMKTEADACFLAALMVQIGEAAGCRTVALVTGMDQPLGRFAGNACEIIETFELLRGDRNPLSKDLRELSIGLAGWMIYLSGNAPSRHQARELAEKRLDNLDGENAFNRMIQLQGGDPLPLLASGRPQAKFTRTIPAPHTGYLSNIDCEQFGWAVQRLGAGRVRTEDSVSPNAGIELHAKLGSHLRTGQPLVTLFTDDEERLDEAGQLILTHTHISPQEPMLQPLVRRIITAEDATGYLYSRS